MSDDFRQVGPDQTADGGRGSRHPFGEDRQRARQPDARLPFVQLRVGRLRLGAGRFQPAAHEGTATGTNQRNSSLRRFQTGRISSPDGKTIHFLKKDTIQQYNYLSNCIPKRLSL